MAKSEPNRLKKIRIRPFAIVDPETRDGSGDPHLSIEVDGRIQPLTKFIEIVGEIIPADRPDRLDSV
ncbi:MAG: hypothetical protein AAFU65_01315 [Pseudomonadota bacterium]